MRIIRLILMFVAVAMTTGCHHLDDDRIPPYPVNITFHSVADWNFYGVGGAMDYRYFILSDRVPSGFPYAASSATGFGGVLLVCDVNGTPLAYDMACPVECRNTVRVRIDDESLTAQCPVCHSTYDIFNLGGHPLSGIAAERGYGLRRYVVSPGLSSVYMVIHN